MLAFVSQIAFLAFPVAMAYAAASDLLTMTIPNRLVLALVAGFVLLAPLTGMSLATFGMHFAAAGVVLLIAFACFAFGWIGGGDAKTAAAAALWLGWGPTLDFVAIGAVMGGALTLVLLSFRQLMLPSFAVRQLWIARLHAADTGVPYGIALAGAALTVYPETVWMTLVAG